MNRNDVIDVLTAVSAADRRTVGDADVDVWQAVIGELPVDKALRAVRDHLKHKPGVWIEPGHVYQGARAIIRDEVAREPDSARDARQKALEAKVRESAAELAAGKAIPAGAPSRRRHPGLAVRCPWCHAIPGRPCVVPRTNDRPAGGMHPSRIELAAERAHA